MTFLKLGDRVRIKSNYIGPLSSSYKKGDQAVYQGDGNFKMANGITQSCRVEWEQEKVFAKIGKRGRPVKNQPTAKQLGQFKVGDRVRVITCYVYNSIKIGHIGVIKNIDTKHSDNDYSIELDNSGCWLKPEWLELVDTDAAQYAVCPTQVFNSEDEVKKWLEKTVVGRTIDVTSIRIFEIKKEYRAEASFSLKAA